MIRKSSYRLTALLLALLMLFQSAALAEGIDLLNLTKETYDQLVSEAAIANQNTLVDRTLTAEDSNFSFAVAGEMPKSAELYVSYLGADTTASIRSSILGVDELEEGEADYAFDISIANNGEEWQPDSSVQVTVTGLDVTADSDVLVYHIPDSQPAATTWSLRSENTSTSMNYEEVTATAGDGTVTFMADGFSVYYVLSGTQSKNVANNDEIYLIPGSKVSLYPSGYYTYTLSSYNIASSPENVNTDAYSLTVDNSNRVLFSTTPEATLGIYTLQITWSTWWGTGETTLNITIHVVDYKGMIASGIPQQVVFTCVENSSNIPSEPTTTSTFKWKYIHKDDNGDYYFQDDGIYNKDPSVLIDIDKFINSGNLIIQSINDTDNVFGIVDRNGDGADTLPLIKLSDEEWHTILVAFCNKYYSLACIPDGNGGSTYLNTVDLDEKLPNSDQYRYQMVPYVVKLINNSNGNGWHVDCIIIDRLQYSVTYDYNLGAGMTISPIPVKPDGGRYKPNTVVTVDSMKLNNVAVKNQIFTVYDPNTMSTYEYTFVEWNTASDGSGTSYQPGETLPPLTGDVTLYAIWSTNRTTGELKLTKKVEFEDANDTRKNDSTFMEKEYSFTVTIAGADADTEFPYIKYDASNKKLSSATLRTGGTVTLKNGEYIVVKNVPAVDVTVTETVDANASVEDTFVPSWSNLATGNSATVTIVAGLTVTPLTCTNTYAPLVGSLQITKSGMKNGESAIFTVEVTHDGATSTYNVVITGNGSVTIADLPANATYSVAEKDWSWSYECISKTGTNDMITAGQESKVTFVNNKNEQWLYDESIEHNVFGTPAPTTTEGGEQQ